MSIVEFIRLFTEPRSAIFGMHADKVFQEISSQIASVHDLPFKRETENFADFGEP